MEEKPTVIIAQPHLQPVGHVLAQDYDVVLLWEHKDDPRLSKARAIVVAGEFALDKMLIERLPALSLIACFTSGYDGIDVEWARARGLAVTHAPDVNHEDVADHAIGLILAVRRDIVGGDCAVRSGLWTPNTKTLTRSLHEQRLGIVGLGKIGAAIARRGEAMRMKPRWWGPHAKESPWPRAECLLALANDSDILVIAARADETNRGLISGDVMAALGADGLLVNVARGQIVDEDALIVALRNGILGSAALDVFQVGHLRNAGGTCRTLYSRPIPQARRTRPSQACSRCSNPTSPHSSKTLHWSRQ